MRRTGFGLCLAVCTVCCCLLAACGGDRTDPLETAIPSGPDTADVENSAAALSPEQQLLQLAPQLPAAYVATAALYTGLGPDQLSQADVELLVLDQYEILALCCGQMHTDQQEYYAFCAGQYTGMFVLDTPSQRLDFQQLGQRVWMTFDAYEVHGSGYLSRSLVWFEISRSGLGEALRIQNLLHGYYPYPYICLDYEVLETRLSLEDETGGVPRLQVEWREEFFVDKQGRVDLFEIRATDTYTYSERDGRFLPSEHNFSASYPFLTSYPQQFLQIARAGTEEQRQWLADYLALLLELETVSREDVAFLYQ